MSRGVQALLAEGDVSKLGGIIHCHGQGLLVFIGEQQIGNIKRKLVKSVMVGI